MPWSNAYPLLFSNVKSRHGVWPRGGFLGSGARARPSVRITAAAIIVIHVAVGRIISEVACAVAIALLAVAIGGGSLGSGRRAVERAVVPGVVVPGVVVPTAPASALAFVAAGIDMTHWIVVLVFFFFFSPPSDTQQSRERRYVLLMPPHGSPETSSSSSKSSGLGTW